MEQQQTEQKINFSAYFTSKVAPAAEKIEKYKKKIITLAAIYGGIICTIFILIGVSVLVFPSKLLFNEKLICAAVFIFAPILCFICGPLFTIKKIYNIFTKEILIPRLLGFWGKFAYFPPANIFTAIYKSIKNKTGLKGIISELRGAKQTNISINPTILARLLKFSSIFLVTQFLKNNSFIINYLKNINLYDKLIQLIKKYKISDSDISKIDEVKQNFINELLEQMFIDKQPCKKSKFNNSFFNKLNELTFNPFITILGFVIVLFLIYFITFDQYTGTWISDQVNLGFDTLKEIMRNSMNNDEFNEWTQNFFTDGIFDGIFTTLGFVPWIIILSFFTTILEQTGYLSRISITLDSLLDRYGISGRSIVNIIMGTGCNVPSIIMTKNSNSKKERITTIMLLPLVSCSARTVVFGWISQAFGIQQYSFLLILLLTLFSIIIALLLGLLLSNTLFRKEKTIFISEIIPWRFPSILIVLKRTCVDVYDFLRRVLLVIFGTNILIFLLSNLGPTGIADTNNSFMYYISYPFRYMLYPTGIYGTWELSISLLSSFPAKEIAATNLEMFFGGPEEFGNALKLINPHLWPAIIASYLSFFLFYLPCFATAITIKKELGWKYLLLNIFGVFLGSYLLSCIIYNIVGSLSTFHYGDYSSSNISLFVVQIILFVIFITIYLNRIRLQNKGFIESRLLNRIYKYSFIFIILVWSSLIIANNVLMINTNL